MYAREIAQCYTIYYSHGVCAGKIVVAGWMVVDIDMCVRATRYCCTQRAVSSSIITSGCQVEHVLQLLMLLRAGAERDASKYHKR